MTFDLADEPVVFQLRYVRGRCCRRPQAVVAGLSMIPAALTRRALMVLPALVASPDANVLAGVLRGLASHRQRRAFVRTVHNVIDWRGQTVSATRQLGLLRDVPVLVAWGANDTTIPPHHHQSFADRVPHAVLVEIPDAGHYPHETAPDQLLAAMEAFLASTTPFQYSEAGWTDLLTAPHKQSRSARGTEVALVRGVRRGAVMGARRIIEMATGALMELRGCSLRRRSVNWSSLDAKQVWAPNVSPGPRQRSCR